MPQQQYGLEPNVWWGPAAGRSTGSDLRKVMRHTHSGSVSCYPNKCHTTLWSTYTPQKVWKSNLRYFWSASRFAIRKDFLKIQWADSAPQDKIFLLDLRLWEVVQRRKGGHTCFFSSWYFHCQTHILLALYALKFEGEHALVCHSASQQHNNLDTQLDITPQLT